MTKHKRSDSPIYSFLPFEVDGFDELAELALNIRWSWNHAADEVWRELDPVLWDLTHNPWVVLQTVARDRLQNALSNQTFRSKVDAFVRLGHKEAESPSWFQQNHNNSPLGCVAYFSMEFMLSEALPIYSGGLGNVAGDQLKAASDLGVPVIGIGLLYQQGYFRQVIDRYGMQQAVFPYNEPGQLPIMPVREANGEWLRLEIVLPGVSLWLRAWQVQVGRVMLYLLDSNDPANLPAFRGVTSELYGGGPELRFRQEFVLGIGGWKLLCALGIKPEVCHMNEGHAALAVLERTRCFMEETGQPFDVALEVTRAGNIFTTHTPVAAGFDRFSPAIIEQFHRRYAEDALGISLHDLLALGRQNPNDPSEPFNMAYLAIRGSRSVNGVSRLHGEVSRRIFQPLFPQWPEVEVPVGHVTNGVHMPSWDSAEADELWTSSCSQRRWLGTTELLEKQIRCIPDDRLWQFRADSRMSLITYINNYLTRQFSVAGASPEEIELAKHVFDSNTLTIGFARRFAAYKRPNLLLHDPQRLLNILTNTHCPVQLIIAGKAHPADKQGQEMIRQWIEFIRQSGARSHVVFLSDYDMLLTERLVQGVDVWLNTPRRPWEACGTSGMKVLVNGGINLSELDGWWAEAYSPEVGWALGDGKEHYDETAWDAIEAEALYTLLEQEVVPEFYSRDQNGIPVAWVARMRESMALLTPQFSANRTVREYTEQYYIPTAKIYRERTGDQCKTGKQLINLKRQLEEKWTNLRFGDVTVESNNECHEFKIQVYLNGLNPDTVRVELYAEGIDGANPDRHEMTCGHHLVGAENGYSYSANVTSSRPAADYTARMIPHHPGVAVPLETAQILWQR
jgi:starch phosphorylase